MKLAAIDKFHKTRLGYLVFGLVELGLAYWFVLIAIDQGDLWWYVLTLIFFVGFLQNTVRLAINLSHVTKH
jgi:hypothetical protein